MTHYFGHESIANPVFGIKLTEGDINSAIGTIDLFINTEISPVYETEDIIKEDIISNISYIDTLTYNIDTEYSFYTDYYEDVFKNENNPVEPLQPFLYILADDKNNDTAKYRKVITVDSELQIEPQSIQNSYEYFDEYAKLYNESQNSQEINSKFDVLLAKQKEFYFGQECIINMPDVNKNKNLLPFVNKLSFKTHGMSTFADILQNSNFLDTFCIRQIPMSTDTRYNPININILTDSVRFVNGGIEVASNLTQQQLPGIIYPNAAAMANDLIGFITNEELVNIAYETKTILCSELRPGVNNANTSENRTFGSNLNLGRTTQQPTRITNNLSFNLQNSIRLRIFLERLGQYLKSIRQTPESYLNNRPIPTEVFMYSLIKNAADYQTDPIKQPFLQAFHMPNLSGIEEINFIDSQIKLGKTYLYDLIGYHFTLKQELNIQKLRELTIEQWEFIYTAVNSLYGVNLRDFFRTESVSQNQLRTNLTFLFDTMLKLGFDPFDIKPVIFRKPFFTDQMAAFDHPPPPPEVEIDGMIGVDDKLILRFNSSISEFKAKPVIIQQEDIEIFNKNIISQKLSGLEDEIMFDGDDAVEAYQIFKLDYHPSSYSDFKDNLTICKTTIKETSLQGSNFEVCEVIKRNHASFIDSVIPNKKYYYVFRTVDIHGNISNPSLLYEVELVNSEGTIYPIIKIVDFLKIDDKQPTKTARRFLYITPNAMQSLINEQASGYFDQEGNIKQQANLVLDNVVLGLANEKMWNKNYRLKIRSKTTGKLVEVDFKFTYKTMPNIVKCE